MSRLFALRLRYIAKQKIIWIYLFFMALITVYFCWNLVNNPSTSYSGAYFPLYMRFWIVVLFEPLFLAILASYLINHERNNGMFRQPLLHGFSRVEILHVNLLLLMLCAITFLLYFHAIAFLCGLFAWGSEMLTVDAVLHTLFQDLLLAFPLCTFCVAIVLLCLYTKDSVSVVAFSFIALLLDNLVNQFFIEPASKLSFLFYIYGYSEFNGHQLESRMYVYGILLSVFTAILLYVFANRKMKSIEL